MSSNDSTERKKILQQLETETFDLAVIGGGITGAGVARDAASRGMKVALIESNDFASGTSSRSSKLIHGGIRYLENLEFGLVFEALQERQRLYDLAPHLVHPLRFLLPLYQGDRVGPFKMGLGMMLYDVLALFEAEAHERLSSDETLSRQPFLKSEKLRGSFVYSDAYMDDDRLVLETLRSSEQFGAVCLNYCKAGRGVIENDSLTAIECQDLEGQKTFKLKAKHFVSSVGPWTDQFGEQLIPGWKRQLRPTKGIHLTLRRDRLPLKEAVVMATHSDSRIIFAIPRHEMIILGTTDTEFSGDPRNVRTEAEDVRYLLKIVSDYFPGANLTLDDIVASYAGVRPLIHDGAQTESKTSREHKIWNVLANLTCVAGGKYTTYRHMSEQVVKTCLSAASFSIEDQLRFRQSNTLIPLNPLASKGSLERAISLKDEIQYESQMPMASVLWLLERYGLEAVSLIEHFDGKRFPHHWHLEALHHIRHTQCRHLVDFYLRRVPLFLMEKDHGLFWLESLTQLFAEELGWDIQTCQQEKDAVLNHLKNELGWKSQLS